MLLVSQLRKWAAQVARQAGEEPDIQEAQRLMSIAEFWVRLAENEESQLTDPTLDLAYESGRHP